MLSLAVAMALSMQVESMVSPGRCHSAANRFNFSAPNIRKNFEDDAQAGREGRPTRYTEAHRNELLASLTSDEAASATVMARYGSARIKPRDEQVIRSLGLMELLNLLRGCAAAA